MPPIRLLVLASDPLARAGLAGLLAPWSEVSIVGAAAPAELVRPANVGPSLVSLFNPEALLWDLGSEPRAALAQLDGLENQLTDPPLPIVFLLPGTTHLEAGAPRTRQAQAAIARGGWSLLLREANPAALVHALACALDGLAVIDPLLLPWMLGQDSSFGQDSVLGHGSALPSPVEDLTPRELQVLKLIAEGLSNKQIGQALGVRENTVKFHVNAILGKLSAASRTEAVTRAARLGWLAL